MLGVVGKRWVLVLHLTLACLWVGGVVAMLGLDLAKDGWGRADALAAIDRAIFTLHETVVVTASLSFVFTGLVFSALTPWGFVQFRWVVAKWLATLALAVWIVMVATPAGNGLSAASDVLGAAARFSPEYGAAQGAFRRALGAELAVLVGVLAVSVFKPWGRRAPAPAPQRRRWVLGASVVLAVLAALGIGAQVSTLAALRDVPALPVDTRAIADGRYCGRAALGGFEYRMAVSVRGGRIVAAEVLAHRDSLYARLAEGIARKVVDANRNDVDAVSGATTTSVAMRAAIEQALRYAGTPAAAC